MYIKSVLFYFLSFILWTKEIPSGSSFHKLILWNTGYSQYQTLVDDQFCLHTDPGGTLKFPLNTIIRLCQNKQNLYFYLNNDKFHTSYLNTLKKINPKILEISYSNNLISNHISNNHKLVSFGHLDKIGFEQTFSDNIEIYESTILQFEKLKLNRKYILEFLETRQKLKNIRLNERYDFGNYLIHFNEDLNLKKNSYETKNRFKTGKINIFKYDEMIKNKKLISLVLPNHGQPKFLNKRNIKEILKFNMLIAGSQSKKYENHKLTEKKFIRLKKPVVLKNQWGHLIFETKL